MTLTTVSKKGGRLASLILRRALGCSINNPLHYLNDSKGNNEQSKTNNNNSNKEKTRTVNNRRTKTKEITRTITRIGIKVRI